METECSMLNGECSMDWTSGEGVRKGQNVQWKILNGSDERRISSDCPASGKQYPIALFSSKSNSCRTTTLDSAPRLNLTIVGK